MEKFFVALFDISVFNACKLRCNAFAVSFQTSVFGHRTRRSDSNIPQMYESLESCIGSASRFDCADTPKGLHAYTSPRNIGLMFIKSLQIAFIGLVVFTADAWAGNSALQGIVKDPKGQPVKGADIRIEAKDGSKLFKTVKTDASGHYISDALPAGTYRVTLIVNGTVKASINNTKTKLGAPTELNFDLKPASTSQASGSAKKGKHWVWIPPTTGTHLGGRWVEIDDNASGQPGSLNVDRVSAEELERQAHSAGMSGQGR